jgi:MFS transporter, MHS family, shikimate and dehydroshikimate transport protein
MITHWLSNEGVCPTVLLVLLRIIQGIGVVGEFGVDTSVLAEFGAKRRPRAFWMSLANLGMSLGLLSASGVFLVQGKSFATPPDHNGESIRGS